jgi:hypothetical protein
MLATLTAENGNALLDEEAAIPADWELMLAVLAAEIEDDIRFANEALSMLLDRIESAEALERTPIMLARLLEDADPRNCADEALVILFDNTEAVVALATLFEDSEANDCENRLATLFEDCKAAALDAELTLIALSEDIESRLS